jgi:DUF1680 family protein
MTRPAEIRNASHRRLYPVPLSNVTLADDFWSPKLQTMRTVTINDVFDKFERGGAFANFDRTAQWLRQGHQGAPWFDGLIFESIRAASDFLASSPDAQLEARLDGYIERIAAAQAVDPDGYLNTFVTLMRPEQRWGQHGSDQRWTHEEYNAGCLVEAAVHHYRATGKRRLLAVAIRFANYMCAYIGPAPKHNVVPSHSLPEEAFVKLYQLLRDEPALADALSARDPGRYLDLVRFWMEQRGHTTGRIGFAEYAQDHRPVLEQTEAVGHSVRATLLYTGLAALAAETGDPTYFETSRRLWDDVVERKMFITGGVGPVKEYEGFGYGYFLPSGGYIETCAGVGLAFWASQMNQAFGGAEYMDIYERVAYNNVLAGLSLAGTCYSYENPLHSNGKMHRWEWHVCPCCPPMLLKLFSEMPGLIYARDDTGIFVHLYIGSRASVTLPWGEVQLTLNTRYPWDGSVRVTVEATPEQSYAMHLRLPAWSPSVDVQVNGVKQPHHVVDGYMLLERVWRAGDVIELEFPMPVQRIVSHPFVNESRERVVIQRGPVVYCLEGVDHPGRRDPVLPAQAQFQSQYRADMLDGVVVVTAKGVDGDDLVAIPYYAWDNRAEDHSEHSWLNVWVKQDAWHRLRQPMDDPDHRAWEHALYRPVPGDAHLGVP